MMILANAPIVAKQNGKEKDDFRDSNFQLNSLLMTWKLLCVPLEAISSAHRA